MTKRIPLRGKHGEGRFALVDDEDFEQISHRRWWLKLYDKKWPYAVCAMYVGAKGERKQRYFAMHRLVAGAESGEQVDHINGDTLDNRRANLRIVTNAQNQQNRHKVGGLSRYKGVCWNRAVGKWQTQIKLNGKSKYLGIFDDEREAALAYDAAARGMFGDYANLNFPKGAA